MAPKFFSFVLTNMEGTKIFYSVLIIKENPTDPSLRESLEAFNVSDPTKIAMPKALVMVSHYSFTQNYKELLKALYSIHLSKMPFPIERYITNIVDEIPCPDKGNIQVEYEIGSESLSFF